MLEIRLAAPADLEDVLNVIDDAAAWLQSIGVTEQWPASFSADPAWVARFQRWIGEGRVYCARDGAGAAAGCFRLMPSDLHIWGDDTGGYLYLHSLAVRRSAAGDGVAAAMLGWAREYAASQGAEELRLDCWAGNERLVRYYADAGFEPRGEAHVIDGTGGQWSMKEYWVAKFAWRLR